MNILEHFSLLIAVLPRICGKTRCSISVIFILQLLIEVVSLTHYSYLGHYLEK